MTVPSVPNYVYRDTSLVIATIVPGLPHARASDAFCTQLARQGSRIGFSQILRLELSRAIRNLASRRGQLPLNTQQSYRLDEWDTNVAVRQRWMTAGRQKFEAFLDRFDEVAELPFHTAIWEQSVSGSFAMVWPNRQKRTRHVESIDANGFPLAAKRICCDAPRMGH